MSKPQNEVESERKLKNMDEVKRLDGSGFGEKSDQSHLGLRHSLTIGVITKNELLR